MHLLEKLNLYSVRTVTLLIFILWTTTIIAADIITVWATWINFPGDYEQDIRLVRIQALMTATLLSIPTYVFFVLLVRHIELLRRRLSETIRRDDLTGLLSREAFLSDFRAFTNSRDAEEYGAFLIADADYFKRINDTHGHLAGDRALLAITDAMKKSIRETDTIGRLGGEEFAIHLRNVNAQKAMEIAERIRLDVMAASENVKIPDLELSVSIGGVIYNFEQELVSLLAAADKQLYRAKNRGRNRVEFETRLALNKAA